MSGMRFSNGIDYNKLNNEILDNLNLKKGDTLLFKSTGDTATASHRRGIGWYFRCGSTLHHYDGESIKYWLRNGLAELHRV